MNRAAQRLEQFINQAWNLKSRDQYESWLRCLITYSDSAVGPEFTKPITDHGGYNLSDWEIYRDRQASYLEGQITRIEQKNLIKTE